jgi:hypothetical protein
MKKIILLAMLCIGFQSKAQWFPEEETNGRLAEEEYKEFKHTTELWLGTYTKYRLSEKWFYYGEYHLRRKNRFIDDMGQIYLRFGMTYLINNQVEVTGGVVTPFYWNPHQNTPGEDNIVPQYRLWQQLILVQPLGRLKLYHQFRTEQRWRREFTEGAPFELTWRFRYKIQAYYPLNNTYLVNRTLFLAAYEEIFIQAGKSITYNYMEDNRMFLGLGYIVNENIQIQAGYMWTFRFDGGPNNFEHRHIPRISLYHNLDLSLIHI